MNSRTVLPQLKIQEKATEMVKGGRGASGQDLHPRRSNPQVGEISQMSLRSEGFKALHWSLQPWGPALERQVPITSGFENQWDLTLGESEGCR